MIEMMSSAVLGKASDLIKRGALVAFPTETVYGLGANAYDGEAVARIFEMKKRPAFNPLISHFADIESVLKEGILNDHAIELATRLWPAPLSLIVKKRETSQIHDLISAGLDTIAVRIPNNPTALNLIKQVGCPIAAPSANLSGRLSPTSALHVYNDFGDDVPLILSDGVCEVGLESTVVDCTGEVPVIVRRGFYDEEHLSEICGVEVTFEKSTPDKPISPGQVLNHYAPRTSLKLNVSHPTDQQAYIDFGPTLVKDHKPFYCNLSDKGVLVEAAARLFALLHECDQLGLEEIAVAPIPDQGIGMAINDRLRRAAS